MAELELNLGLSPSIQHCFHSSYGPSLCPKMWCGFTEIMQQPTLQTCLLLLVFGWELKNTDTSNKSHLYFYSLMEGFPVNLNYILFQRIVNVKKISTFMPFFLYSSLPQPPSKRLNPWHRWLQLAAVVHHHPDKGGLWGCEHVQHSSRIKRSCLNELMP